MYSWSWKSFSDAGGSGVEGERGSDEEPAGLDFGTKGQLPYRKRIGIFFFFLLFKAS